MLMSQQNRPHNMQAQSMLGDAEIVAGRQADAMNFEYEDSSEPRRA